MYGILSELELFYSAFRFSLLCKLALHVIIIDVAIPIRVDSPDSKPSAPKNLGVTFKYQESKPAHFFRDINFL